MAQVDFSRREITIKLVYYGPALSGKTTNLQKLHARLVDAHRSRLLTLDTANDRTLFFDLLPISFVAQGGPKVVIKLFTVPGQVMHNNTRRLVLRSADGVAFIADSQLSETRANNEAYAHLRENLRDNGLDPDAMPVVIQFNKRDLQKELIRDEAELAEIAQRGRESIVTASAIEGVGVLETFFTLAALTWDSLEKSTGIGSRHQISKADFLSELGRRLQAPELARQASQGRSGLMALPPEGRNSMGIPGVADGAVTVPGRVGEKAAGMADGAGGAVPGRVDEKATGMAGGAGEKAAGMADGAATGVAVAVPTGDPVSGAAGEGPCET